MAAHEAAKAFADEDDFVYVARSCAVARISVKKVSKFLFAALSGLLDLHHGKNGCTLF